MNLWLGKSQPLYGILDIVTLSILKGDFTISKKGKPLLIYSRSPVTLLLLELAYNVVYVQVGPTSCITGAQQMVSTTRGCVSMKNPSSLSSNNTKDIENI